MGSPNYASSPSPIRRYPFFCPAGVVTLWLLAVLIAGEIGMGTPHSVGFVRVPPDDERQFAYRPHAPRSTVKSIFQGMRFTRHFSLLQDVSRVSPVILI